MVYMNNNMYLTTETCVYWPESEIVYNRQIHIIADFKSKFIVLHVYSFFRSLQSHNALSSGGNFLSIFQGE